jgi:hypothetical protein
MRSVLTSVTTLALLVLATTLAATKPGCAGTVINVCGKFSFWIPDDWKAASYGEAKAERSTFESPDATLYVLVGPLTDKDADITDEDVTDFADEELDEMKVTSDTRDTLEKFNVRLVEGTGIDEGDPVIFRMLALDPGTTEGVLAVMVYGDARTMNRAENRATIERILRSVRPH